MQFTDLKNPELDNALDSELGYTRMANVDHGHVAKRLKTLSAVSSHFLSIDMN